MVNIATGLEIKKPSEMTDDELTAELNKRREVKRQARLVKEPTEYLYNDKPCLSLPCTMPLSFGVSKAKSIVKYIDSIKAFAEKHKGN